MKRVLAIAVLAAACGGARRETGRSVTVRGSDTMVVLAQRWAEGYMAEHPDIAIQVSGGGSGTGLAALISGTTDIANASRAIKASEIDHVVREHGAAPIETEVAVDAIAIYVHEDNPIASISPRDLERVYRGTVEEWSDLPGGPDLGKIIIYSRENSSGTYAYFKDVVLRGFDFAAEAQTLPGTAAVLNAVSKDPGAIGYGGVGYGSRTRVVPLRLEDGEEVMPDRDTTMAGRYPLARPLFIYTLDPPPERAADFIHFVLSAPGQDMVRRLGFFPLPPGGMP